MHFLCVSVLHWNLYTMHCSCALLEVGALAHFILMLYTQKSSFRALLFYFTASSSRHSDIWQL